MKNYVGIKLISAEPMNRSEYNELRGWVLPEDENGEDEGYLVEYRNTRPNVKGYAGYISWSPKDVFEEAYKQGEDTEDASDGHHTFSELYEFRKMYNAVLFNQWAKTGKYDVHKSKRHSDGEHCFGVEDKWFIVSAILPGGQISNHYKMEDWDLFHLPAMEICKHNFDGHTPEDVLERLHGLCLTRK